MESPILRPPSPSFSENLSPPPNEADKKVQQWLEAMKTHQDMGDGSKDSYQRLTSFLQGVLPTGTDTKSDPASTIASTTLNPPAVVSPISNLDNSNGMLNPSLGPNSLLTPTAQPFINHKENNDDSVYCSDSGQSCRCNIEVFGPVWSPFHMNTSKFYWGNSPQDYISSLVPNNQYSSQAPYTPFTDVSNNEENKISYGNPVDTKLLGGLLFTSIPGLPTSWTQPNDSASNSDWVNRLKNLNVSLIPLNESHVILLPCGQGPSLNNKSPQGSPDSFSPNPHNTGRTTETQPHPNANENRIQSENVPTINTWDPLHSSSSPSSSGTFHKFDVLRLINNRVHTLENRALYYDATITEWKGKYGELLKTNAELKQELLVMKQLLYQAMNLVGKKWKEENETRHNTTEIINLQHKLNYTASRVKQLNNLLQDMDSIHKERMETLQNSINEIQRHIWIQMIGASLGTTMFLFLLFRAVGSTRWLLDVPRHRIRIQRPIFMDSDSMSGSPLLSKSGSMLQEMDSITLSEPMTPSGNNWGDLKALIYIPTLAEQSPPNDSPGPDSQNFTPREMSLLRDDRLGPSFERPDLESEGDECKRHEQAHLVHNQETEEDEEYLNLSCSKRDAPIDETTSAFDSS